MAAALAGSPPPPCQQFPATGQTTAYTADKNDGIAGPVAVPDDGTLETGATLGYTDNGDGTITDLNTGLTWEKKSDDGGLHDRDDRYPWSGDGTQETIWDWLEDVNAEGGTGFAGYDDWRIPNVRELQSIIDYGRGAPFSSDDPAVDPVFNTACVPACTVLTCSCIEPDFYWSSSTQVGNPLQPAWLVDFGSGRVDALGEGSKSNVQWVRAVRGGSP